MNLLYRFYWIVLRIVTKLFLGLRKSGLENLPDSGGAIIACNHLSVADPPLIGSALPRGIYYFAKSELFGKWYSSFLIETLNTIPVQRGTFDRNALEKGLEVIRRGEWLLVFPEGTRSKDGKLKQGKSGAAKLSLETGAPVIPACIRNSNKIIKTVFSTRCVTLRFGQPLHPEEYEKIGLAKERLSRFTDEIMKRISILMQDED